jgi:diaminopropionate ammonia-lyase
MAGLNCGLASMLALPVITAGFDAVVTIDDDRCRDAIGSMAAAGLDVGECAAAGLGALVELAASHGGVVPIPTGATALVLATEGVTDPALFEQIVGRPPHP